MNKVIKKPKSILQARKTMEYKSFIEYMHTAKWFMRITASLQIFCFLFAFYSPSVQAVTDEIAASTAVPQIQGETDEEKLSNALQAIKENVVETKAAVDTRMLEESGITDIILNFFGLSEMRNEPLTTLQGLNAQVQALNKKALANFAKIETMLKAKNLPDEILQRHYDAVSKYQADYTKLQSYIQKCAAAGSLHDQQNAMDELNGFMQAQKFKRTHQTDDPNNLPFGTPNADDTRKPITDSEQLSQLVGNKKETRLAEKILNAIISPAYADEPIADDLAETIDVQLTDAIRAKAQELNNNPVEIYNWVRNNVEFIPTYGSIQGADYTLQTLSGNPFDTSSLLIALLRAANIPARYAYGTVSIPVEKVMNWVGGVEVPEAAQQLLGQGGIPNIAQVNGGKITHIKMEHIWVEAWVDFQPSRGAKNIQGDSWVPLDASFKQYAFTDPIDLQSQVPFDANAFAQTIVDNAIVDDAAGTVQNIDKTLVDSQLLAYQQQVGDFVNSNLPNASANDIIGKKIIQESINDLLAAGLPYKKITQEQTFSTISNNLRHKYRFTLKDDFGGIIFSQTLDLPSISGSTIALSFKPKTATDEETLADFFPEGSTTLPDSIPGYLVNVEGEFVVDKKTIASGGVFQLGAEVNVEQTLFQPATGWLSPTANAIVAGEYQAIGVVGSGISEKFINTIKDELTNVKNQINAATSSPMPSDLSKHQITGLLLQAGILGYFLVVKGQDRLAAQTSDVVSYNLPSYGTFSTIVETQYLFGIIPRSVSFPGVFMDVDRNAMIAEAKSGDNTETINYVRGVGSLASSNEHFLPELLFSTATNPVHGVSAIKALQLASDQGQKIFNLTSSNSNQINNVTIDSGAKAEILNALDSGKEVLVHESPIDAFGFSGSGYIITDPLTGSGAYKISGGSNGDFTAWVDENNTILNVIGFSASALSLALSGGFLVLAVIVALVIAAILSYASYLALEASISGTACEDSGLLELYAAILTLGAIIGAYIGGGAGGAFGAMLISLLANAVPSSATSATCPPN